MEIGDPRLSNNLGIYLLGATAPDVRIITKRPRIETHFFELDTGRCGDGASGLLSAYPQLASPVSDAQAAFVAGYISHLVADETWITSMYRPHFGGSGSSESDATDQVMDRAAQLSLDRACEQRVRRLLPQMREAPINGPAGPIDAPTLGQWRSWVVDFLADDRPYSWERLRHMAGRISGRDPNHPARELAEQFLSDVPEGLRKLHLRVSEEDLQGYLDLTAANLVAEVGGYLEAAGGTG